MTTLTDKLTSPGPITLDDTERAAVAAAFAELARSVGYRYSYDPRKDEYAHSSGIMVLTPEGKIARYFFGLTYPERDLRYGIEDASAGKIGSPMLQPVRLMCFTYDPTTGQYTLLTMRLVRIGGVLTLVGLGGFWLWSWWRGRRRA